MNFFSKLLMVLGMFCILFSIYLFWQRVNPNRLSFALRNLNYEKTSRKTTALPVLFQIPALKLGLPIIPSTISNRNWQTTDQGVSYLATSPIPGTHGNSIIYGHNWTNLLGNLVYARPGTTIIITYSDHTKKIFKITSTAVVLPTEVSILYPSNDNRITVYTCTGFLDSKRFVAVAKLL